ncbi:MAG TPA: bifunctional DNA primase/polymerase [Acidimicrobiales bacterium]|nr:bifunctional DNA primase/polymerase [Acidimicrobiales bacterium]
MTADRVFADEAIFLASLGWSVFPLCYRGKAPLTAHGHRDGTTDLALVARWARKYPRANIGARVVDHLVVLDVDPRNGGDESLAALGTLPSTLTSVTGAGGRHLFFRRPLGELMNGAHKLGPGVDVKVGGRGYVVLPPSVHPNGQRYEWMRPLAEVAALPAHVVELLRPPVIEARPMRHHDASAAPRPGDVFNATTSWSDVLEPHGWRFVGQRGDLGYWCRPGKRAGVSATTNALGTDRLHVFTSSAPPLLADTSYDRFGAFAALHYGGDLTAAARALRAVVT